MAETALTVQNVSFKGVYTALDPFTPAPLTLENPDQANGNKFTNTRGKVLLIVTNNEAFSIDVTFDATITVAEAPDNLSVTDPTITIAPGDTNIFGPFTGNFEAASEVIMSWADIVTPTNVDVAVIKLP